MRLDYERDAVGRIVQKTEARFGVAFTEVYGYDVAGRLETVHRNGALASTYVYDSNGNRLSKTTDAGVEAGTYDAQDRMLTYAGASYTYRSNGELATKTDASGTTSYDYDVLGNLRRVDLPAGTVIEYVVDGQNRRVGKKLNGTVARAWLYANQLRAVAELDGDGNIVSRFVYGSRTNVPDFMIRGSVTYRFVADHLGSVRYVIDATTGAIAQTIEYDEFGEVIDDSNPAFQPFGFAGGLSERDTALTRFGARDYDPQTGRWTARDPIGFGGGDTNLYGYALSDSVNLIDPDGMAVVYTGPAPTQVYQDAAQIRAQGHQLYPGEANSSARHAYGAEQMTERYGPDIARAFGVLNEVQGFLWHDLWRLRDRIAGRSPWAFQEQDLVDNETGIARGTCTYNARRVAERRRQPRVPWWLAVLLTP